MPARTLLRVIALSATLLLALPTVASADPNPPSDEYDYSPNMEPLGIAPRPIPPGSDNTDIAFWGDTAYEGTYWGFHIVDISDPENPTTINNYEDCRAGQGDVIVWENLLVRSWNSAAPANATCDGEPVPEGWEGIHIFDVSNPLNPDLLGAVETECGSHTATAVPDPENERLIVYNNPSSGTCPGFDIIEIPLTNPAAASIVGTGEATRACHDTAVILGTQLRAACAGGNGFSMFSLGGARGGSLTEPQLLYSHPMPMEDFVTIGHAAAFSWDGDIVAFGHEPGGGVQAECQETIDDVQKKRTMYFFYTETGTQVGEFTMPRGQSSSENCTIHNFNVVPTDQRYILVAGNYQSGISVVDFTNPGNPEEIAYADPHPLVPERDGGDWSSYWYDGTIYESDIFRGLLTWRLNDPAVAGARTLGHLNPQTQEESSTFTGKIGGGVRFACKGKATTVFGTATDDVLKGTSGRDVFSTGNGRDRIKGGGGRDVVCAGKGKDVLRGAGGKDRLLGGRGRDLLIGGGGKDICRGGPKPDEIRSC